MIPVLEFKAKDGAWYTGSPSFADGNEAIRVHFHGFPRDEDEIWYASSFKSFYHLNAVVRPISDAMQDSICKYVDRGRIVCVACRGSEGAGTLKYYDAVVQQVIRSRHRHIRDAELCECQFEIKWREGPFRNMNQFVPCGDLCLPALGDIQDNPVIKDFIKMIEYRQSANQSSTKPIDAAASTH